MVRMLSKLIRDSPTPTVTHKAHRAHDVVQPRIATVCIGPTMVPARGTLSGNNHLYARHGVNFCSKTVMAML